MSSGWSITSASAESYRPYWKDVLANTLRPDPHGTYLQVLDENGTLLGLCGVTVTKDFCTFKSDYVPPEHRGKGVWRYMQAFRIELCLNRGITRIRATVTPMILDAWLRRGARILKTYPNGNTKVGLYL